MYTIRRMPQFDAWFDGLRDGLRDGLTRRRLALRLRKATLEE